MQGTVTFVSNECQDNLISAYRWNYFHLKMLQVLLQQASMSSCLSIFASYRSFWIKMRCNSAIYITIHTLYNIALIASSLAWFKISNSSIVFNSVIIINTKMKENLKIQRQEFTTRLIQFILYDMADQRQQSRHCWAHLGQRSMHLPVVYCSFSKNKQ